MVFIMVLAIAFISTVHAKPAGSLEFLTKLDLTLLDWLTPKTISLDFTSLSDEDFEILHSIAMKIEAKITNEKVGLFITTDLSKLAQEMKNESESGDFIRNSKLTYLIRFSNKSMISKQVFQFKNQPYFYIWIQEDDFEQLFEYQQFSGSPEKKVPLVYWNKSSNEIRYENQDIYQRRHDFYGKSIRIAHEKVPYRFSFCPDDPNELSGFNGKLLQYFRQEFNFTIIWKPFESYGLTLDNGTWTGSIGSLINHQLDFGPGWFTHSKERMSVVAPGFRLFQDSHSILYRNGGKKSSPFWALLNVFDAKSWVFILAFAIFQIICLAMALKIIKKQKWFMSSILTVGKAILCLSVNLEELTSRQRY